MGERFTVRLSEENAEWVVEESSEKDRSKAWIIDEVVSAVRGAESTYSHRTGAVRGEESDVDADLGEIRARLSTLEGRVDALEPADVPPATEPPVGDGRDGEEPEPPAAGDVDAIGEALTGWSYGRTEEEQAANDSVARASLEWLRETGEAVRQSDVPLAELAEDDPEGRKQDTLWRTVIRGAWQHADGQGYVDRPDSRAYVWTGPDDAE